MNSSNMNIRTTLNVRAKWYDMMYEYAQKKGMKVDRVIILLLEEQIARMSKHMCFRDSALQYQERGYVYKQMHVTLSCFQYSRFRDVMLCFRFCLSFILSLAMESFDEIMSQKKIKDSYPGEAYTKIITSINNMNIFLHMWGIPTKQHTLTVPPG